MENKQETQKEQLHYNYPAIIVLILYPILLAVLVYMYKGEFGFTTTDLAIAITSYYVCNITVGISLHRLWSHGSYKTKPWVEFILMLLSAGCLQGPALVWASDHKMHHAYADGEKDPHTPVKYKNKMLGLLWSHIGWMLLNRANRKHIDIGTMTSLGKKKALVFQLRYYWQVASFMNIIPPILFGMAAYGKMDFHSAAAGFLFVGVGRALQQQMTFCVNSLCHFVGSKKYANDSSCDVWWLAPLLLGENWHNFHHAFGRDYRNGHKWYHFDMHKWIIWSMSKVGLAWDLVTTSEERISATISEINSVTIKPTMESVIEMAEKIAETAYARSLKIKELVNNLADNICDPNNAVFSDFSEIKSYIVKNSATRVNKLQKKVESRLYKISISLEKLQKRAKELAIITKENTERNSKLSITVLEKNLKKLRRISIQAQKLGIEYAAGFNNIMQKN